MSAVYEHPRGDTSPFEPTLRQANGQPIDLTNAIRVTITLRRHAADRPILQRDADLAAFPRATGKVRLTWHAGDPNETLGSYRVWARIEYPGEAITVPTRAVDAFILRVTPGAG